MELKRFDEGAKYHFAKIELRDVDRATLAKITFTQTISEKLGLGTLYRSCDLFWADEEQMIVLKIFKDPEKGQRKMSFGDRGVQISATMFLEQFDVPFAPRTRYRVMKKEGDLICIPIKNGRATWNLRREVLDERARDQVAQEGENNHG